MTRLHLCAAPPGRLTRLWCRTLCAPARAREATIRRTTACLSCQTTRPVFCKLPGNHPDRLADWLTVQYPTMRSRLPDLTLFDLDNTLLAGDSDFTWNVFMCNVGAVEKKSYQRRNRMFYQQYQAEQLDVDAYLRFVLEPLTGIPPDKLNAMHEEFMEKYIEPMITPAALELVNKHRDAGDITAIITATNRFITAPIAERFNVANLIATEPEYRNGRLTGEIVGTPCFREGKLECLRRWLKKECPSYGKTRFYSDSRNDLALLSQVDYPVVTNGDPELLAHARARKWPTISLRQAGDPTPEAG